MDMLRLDGNGMEEAHMIVSVRLVTGPSRVLLLSRVKKTIGAGRLNLQEARGKNEIWKGRKLGFRLKLSRLSFRHLFEFHPVHRSEKGSLG